MTENKRLPQSILLLERLWLNKFRCPRQTGEGRWINSATGTQTRVARVRAEYPNQLDYSDSGSRQHQKAQRNSASKSKMQLVVGRAPCSVSGRSWARIPQEAHASADYTAKHLPAFDLRMASSISGHPVAKALCPNNVDRDLEFQPFRPSTCPRRTRKGSSAGLSMLAGRCHCLFSLVGRAPAR